jgi:hypothetical protein
LSIPDVPFPVPVPALIRRVPALIKKVQPSSGEYQPSSGGASVPALIRSQFQAKLATLLILIDSFLKI